MFLHFQSYDAGHRDQCKITAVRHGLGCIITGSSDGTVRVSTPTHHPEFITSFTTIGTEVAAVSDLSNYSVYMFSC